MNILDVFVICMLALWVVLAVVFIIKRRGKGGCSCCSGSCSSCRRLSEKKK